MGRPLVSHLKIRGKIFTASAVLFLPFVALAMITGVMAQRIDGATAELRQDSVPVLSALERVRLEGLRVIESTNTFVLINLVGRSEGRPFRAFSTDKESEMLRAREHFEQAFAALRGLGDRTGGGDESFASNIAFAHGDILRQSDIVAARARTGAEPALILQLRERFDSSALNFRNLIQAAIDAEHAELVDRQVRLGAQTRTIVAVVAILSVVGTLVAVFGGFHLASRIARPILALRDASVRVGGGDFESMPEKNSNDEIGELVDAFGGMTRQLKRNIAERDEAYRAVEKSERRLLKAQRIGQIGSWERSPETNMLRWSPEALRIFGYDGNARDLPPHDWQRFIHPDDVAPTKAILEASRDQGVAFEMRYRIVRPDGLIRTIHERVEPVFDDGGAFAGESGTLQDITDLQNLEEQLHQAQKMQAVGQLTGGIAHDFNNLLSVILGNLELIREFGNLAPAARQGVDIAIRNAMRGAELTHRLLAFSRRQPLAPSPTDVNELIRGLRDLLRQPLGANVDFKIIEGAALWTAVVDRPQLENALLNLVLNACDAMPSGGKLTIETRNMVVDELDSSRGQDLRPGAYVSVSISDTGCGMSPDVAARAFEPFFTTKGVGKGTGLGLSMVYGFMKQTGGHIKLSSREGRGTTIQLLLPKLRSDCAAGSAESAGAGPRERPVAA